MNCVYIIQSQQNNRYYIGSTNDLNRRIKDHNDNLGCKYTKFKGPWKLVCYKPLSTIQQARIEEKTIKSYKSGNAFKKIINGEVAEWSKAAHC